MREYNVNYDAFNEERLIYKGRHEACYAELIRASMPNGITKVQAYYWTEPPTTKKDADWFVKNFIIPTIPERIAKTFTVESIPDHAECAKDGSGKYWATVTFDTKKISSFDLFALLTLFRYPQEQPKFVSSMKEHISKGLSLNDAFLCAHSTGSSQNWGHLLIGYKFYYASMGGGKINIQTNIKQQWEKLDATHYKTPYNKCTYLLTTLHGVFDVVYSEE